MAAADVPRWGFGQPPMETKPADGSFVPFFPPCDSTSTDTNAMTWSAKLAAPTPHIRLPAWVRVPIQPHSSTGQTSQIMKRIGLCARRYATPAASIAAKVPEPSAPTAEDIALDEDARRIRRRGAKHEFTQEDAEFNGQPCSRAEMANLLMQAKVDVSNNFMATSSGTTLEDKRATRRGTYVQVVPQKRHARTHVPEISASLAPSGGNKLPIYHELIPIIKRAMRNGMNEVNLTTASIAEASSIMRQMRRNPRQQLAAFGAPDLSDIMDSTEPESPTLIRRPILKAESRSPQKRISRLTTPLKNGMRRLTTSVVKLVPGASPKLSPSPTKSDSAPSTPLRRTPSPAKPAITPGGIDSSPLSRTAYTARENLSVSTEQVTPQAGRVFRAPSYNDSSSQETPSNVDLSPIKYARPVAPTPSRWHRAAPTTPQAFTPMPTIRSPATPSQTSSPIGLASLLPPSTPQLPKCNFVVQTPRTTTFNFGEVSPSFNSISWMNASVQASEPKRIKNVNAARRRQSEPLLVKYLKTQARRRSSSPRKVRFQEEDIFRDDISIASFFESACSTPAEAAPTKPDAADETAADEGVSIFAEIETAVETAAADNWSNESQPPSNVANDEDMPEPVFTDDDAADKASEASTHDHRGATIEHGIVNIDMRQNPDIFGTYVSSPPAPVYSLSRMADDRCNGHAKVVVTEENGRLFVRFKLSAEYAHMFPASQGFDESRFTTSPSAISSSPRITFKSNQTAFNASSALSSSPAQVDQTPVGPAPRASLAASSPWVERTPAQKNSPMQAPASVSSMLKTPDVTGLGIIKERTRLEASGFRTPELPAHENTLMFRSPDVGFTPANESSAMRATPSIDGLLKTPDVTGLGIVKGNDHTANFQTPELPAFDNTIAFAEPPASTRPMSTRRTSRRQSRITPAKAADAGIASTPKFAAPMGADDTLVVTWPEVKDTRRRTPSKPTELSSAKTPKFATPMAADETLAMSWSPAATTQENNDAPIEPAAVNETPMKDQQKQMPATTPTQKATPPAVATPKTSFTPVNQPTPKIQITEPSDVDTTTPEQKATPTQTVATPETQATPKNTTPVQQAEPAPAPEARRQEYDSPGREYMREFIKRSRQSTTTETGSPIAPAAKRQPLVARSPNRGSPQKNKRKHEDDAADVQSPAKKAKATTEGKDDTKHSTPKRARRTKTSRQKAELEIDMTDSPAAVDDTTQTADVTETQIDDLDMEGPVTRRSSRLRTQTQPSGGPKSSIPTPIKLNRSGAGRNGGAVLNSSVRSEQQDLTHQTRLNTRKNKGNAEYPAQVLAKHAETKQEDDSDSSQTSDASSNTKKGKSVGWRDPIESVQEEKPKKGRTAAKAKATQGKTGITKPKASTPKAKRATKVAENLGMVANGTPAKPQRMTRSRTRSQA
ncbi:hypothetical protein FDECE_10088 [Fusarium decemcellulare]|nr:hypothetical protein FDECE_10088 [Fusarium decemcellulare]